MPPANNRRRANAATRIATAFRAYLARRPTNTTTLDGIPARRRVQIGAHPHDASSIAELMHRENWRDPLTRAPLTDAQAAAAWRMHTRNQAGEARRAGRQYTAPAMPQRPRGGNIGAARQSEIRQWYHSFGNGTVPNAAATAAARRQVNAEVRAIRLRERRDGTAAIDALRRGFAAVLQTPGRRGSWTGRSYKLTYFPPPQNHLFPAHIPIMPSSRTNTFIPPHQRDFTSYVFYKGNEILGGVSVFRDAVEVRARGGGPSASVMHARQTEMSQILTADLRRRLVANRNGANRNESPRRMSPAPSRSRSRSRSRSPPRMSPTPSRTGWLRSIFGRR
jgi:hypothetical protein